MGGGQFSYGDSGGEYLGRLNGGASNGGLQGAPSAPETGGFSEGPSGTRPPSFAPNPAPPPPSYALSSDDPKYRRHEYVDPQGRVHKYETVQDRALNVFGGIVAGIFRSSCTVLRADLVRPYNPKLAQLEGDTDEYDAMQRDKRRRRRYHGQGWEAIDGYMGGRIQGLDRGFYGNGAQLKLMQIWKFEDIVTRQSKLPWDLNFGLGVNFDIDSGKLRLKTRLRSKHVVLRLLPRPDMEVHGKWRLLNTRLGIDVRYRLPVAAPDQFFEATQNGFLSVKLFNMEGAGFSLSPDGGLELDEQVVKFGNHTKFRVAGKMTFPRYFPWDEDEEPFTVEFRRLGVKTVLH